MLALLLLAALVTAGPPWRRGLGLGLAVLLLLWPLGSPRPPLLRGFLALFAFWGAARVLDLSREARPLTPAQRTGFVVAVLDTRQLRWSAPRLDLPALLKATVGLGLGLGALALALACGHHLPRWALRPLLAFTPPRGLRGLLRGVLALLGAESPPLHRAPIAARSLREFWGERWNLIVNRWLRTHFFLPLARRRRPALGFALAFLASAVLHAWFIGVALGPRMAASMALYFIIEGLLPALEVPLGVARWRAPLGRAWMLACTLLPSPLFVEPMLRLVAPRLTLLLV